MRYHQWERGRYRFMIVRDPPPEFDGDPEQAAFYCQLLTRKIWRQSDRAWLDFEAIEVLERLAELVAPDGWQDGTDDMLTNTERVMETRIDYCPERLEAA